MKKVLRALTLTLALCAVSVPALSATVQPQTLQGLITEVGDQYFLMKAQTYGIIRVKLDETLTVYDGVAQKGKLSVGLYVFVDYNGIMARSMPPQITATKVGCYVVSGTVGEILDNGYIVQGDAVFGNVIVHMAAGMPPVFKGVPITLYYSGVMALSTPPQVDAAYLVVPTLAGTVSNATEEGFTLTEADASTHTVALNADTVILTLPADGEQVLVYYSGTFTDGSAVTALEITVVSADEGTAPYVAQ